MTFTRLNDLLARFADYPPERVRLVPRPGTATKQDVIDVERHDGKLCELIDGTLVEKTVGAKESRLAFWIGKQVDDFAEKARVGIVLGSDGTVELFPGQVRIPDFAYYSFDRLPGRKMPVEPIPELHPDIACEVISKSNTKREMWEKLKDYFFAGVKVVWYVHPKSKTVEVYTAVDQFVTLTEDDTLTGGDVLPGFALPVAAIFSDDRFGAGAAPTG